MSDSEDDPAESAGRTNPPEVADPESLAGVPAADDEGAAEAYQQRARLAEDRLAEVLGAYRTLKQENEDVRERQSRNLERRFEQRRERLLLKFIDVLDNLDRALEAAQTSYAGQPLVEGMILVRTQLLQTLQDEGLDRIPVVGLPFDPAVSESVGTAPVKDAEQHHIVVKELLRGYRLNGRIARPSRVVIGVFDGPRAEEPAAAGPETPPAPGATPPAPAPVPPPLPTAAPAAAAAPEDDRDPGTAETARIPTPPMPPPLPPKIPPPRRKGR